MSKINQCQKIRSVNWDKAMGSFKPSKCHKVKEHTVREGCITRRKGKIIREVQTVKIMKGEEIISEITEIHVD